MKKKLIAALSLIIIIVMSFTLLTACKSAEEKEQEYFEDTQKDVTKVIGVIDTLKTQLESANFTTNFSRITKSYSGVTRGTNGTEGWQKKYTDEQGNEQDHKWMVQLIDYTLTWQDTDHIYVKSTEYAVVSEDDYKKVAKKKNYNNVLTVLSEKETVASLEQYLLDNGEFYLNNAWPVVTIIENLESELIKQDVVSVESGNKIYTNILRVDMREVYDSEGALINRDANLAKTEGFANLSEDEAKGENVKYWSGYGEDIIYNWNKVYNITNTRVTLAYSGKKVLKSYEYYKEDILSYYAKKNTVDSTLVLKADVFQTVEAVMDFEFPKKNQPAFTVPTL